MDFNLPKDKYQIQCLISAKVSELVEGESLNLIVSERFNAIEENEGGAVFTDSTGVENNFQKIKLVILTFLKHTLYQEFQLIAMMVPYLINSEISTIDFDLPILAPSILAADKAQLAIRFKQCDGGAQWIHCDIMGILFLILVLAQYCGVGPNFDEAFMDVHLMIKNPDQFIEAFCDAGANLISVHASLCPLHRSIQLIRSHGAMTGVVINPATPVSAINPSWLMLTWYF